MSHETTDKPQDSQESTESTDQTTTDEWNDAAESDDATQSDDGYARAEERSLPEEQKEQAELDAAAKRKEELNSSSADNNVTTTDNTTLSEPPSGAQTDVQTPTAPPVEEPAKPALGPHTARYLNEQNKPSKGPSR